MFGKNPAVQKAGSLSAFRFVYRHWYLFILLIVILPSIFNSIKEAKETNNPVYPLLELGISLINADKVINDDVEILKENPQELIGMEKPEQGLYNKFKYYFHVFLVIWRIFGLIWMISFPFVLIYNIIKLREVSQIQNNFIRTIIYGLIFLFIVNLIFTIYELSTGNLKFNLNQGMDFYSKAWIIIQSTLPFHGLVNLGIYLFNLI